CRVARFAETSTPEGASIMEIAQVERTASFQEMTFPELIQRRDELDAIIKARQTEALEGLHRELASKAQLFGVTLDDVLQHARKPRRVKRPVAAKYRD